MLSTTQSQIHTHPVHLTSPLTFNDQMARIRNIVESMKQQSQKVQPSRRAKSAPTRHNPTDVAPSETASTKRNKRARSETCSYEEPIRVSKRLKGMAADKMEDIVVAVNFGEASEEDDVKGAIDGEKRKKFGRTLSSVTSTTVAEEEGDEMSTQSTLPDDEIESPLFPRSPNMTISGANNPAEAQPSEKIAEPQRAKETAVQVGEASVEETRPLYTNIVPPPVQIDGHPSLRVLYNSTLLHRKSAPLPIHEWQSHYFLAHIPLPLRETHTTQFQEHGHLVIPNTIFSPAPTTDDPILQIISEFLDRFALPKQPFPTFTTFIDSQTHTLNSHAIQWWSQLASYFDIPSYFDRVYSTTPGQWHIVWHSLPTLSTLREFSSVTETLGMKRAREMVHQELARRVGKARGLKKGRKGVMARLGLIGMGYEELREISKKYDTVEKGVGECDFCCVKPDFK